MGSWQSLGEEDNDDISESYESVAVAISTRRLTRRGARANEALLSGGPRLQASAGGQYSTGHGPFRR